MCTKIKGFPEDNQPWRIDWIGQMFKDANELKVRIYISRLKPDAPKNSALNNSSLIGYEEKTHDQRHYDLPIGLIHSYKIGSVWINTEEQLDYRVIQETIEVADPSTPKLLTLTDKGYENVGNGEWRPALTNRQYRVIDGARYGSSVVMIYGHPRYKQIIIPSTVIFQSCYVTSPKAASKIIFGQLGKLIDESDSGYIEGKENSFRITLHQDYKDGEGVMLANFLLDQEAQRNMKILTRNLQIESIQVEKPIFSIKVGFPFSSHTKLKVLGKEIFYDADGKTRKKSENGFLVTEILSVKTKFPFDELLPARKNDASKGETVDENAQGAFGGIAPQNSASDEQLQLTGDDVSSYHEDTQTQLPTIVDISDVTILPRDSKLYQKYVSMPFNPIGSAQAIKTGVGSGEKTQISVGASQLNTTSAPVELDVIFEVIKHLRNHNLDVQELAVLNAQRSDKGVVNFYPYIYHPCRSWHRKEDDSGGRAFVIAQIYLAGKYYYLIDLEPKGKGVLSIALITAWHNQALKTDKLKSIMKMVAIENGWEAFKTSNTKELVFERINHNRKGDSVKVANNILKLLHH